MRPSEEQRNEMLGKVNAAFEKAGGKRLAFCSTYWASEQWQIFGLEVFPDIEAVQIYAAGFGAAPDAPLS